jgi:4-amino-4-deoxy-L-arabinose transferase-like glycosyltransferase
MSAYLINNNTTKFMPVFWLVLFISLQLIVWTLAPYLLVKGMYVDMLENIEWGRHWQLGYDKNPYFGAWLSYAIYYLTNRSFLSLYFTSQLSVIIAWLAIWRLAARMLPAWPALVSSLSLAAIAFYSGISVELNDNVINLSLWALMCWFFYDAVVQQRMIYWLLTGIVAGLASMTKYYTLMLLLPMLLFLLINQQARLSFKRPGLYISCVIFLMITVPNLLWLINNNFISIDYALGRAGMNKSLFYHMLDHIFNPSLFLAGCALFALPLVIIFNCCFKQKTNYSLTLFNKQYIYMLCFGPLILSLLFAVITGARMIFMWSTVLFNLFGLFLVVYYQPVINAQNSKHFFLAVLTLFFIYLLAYIYIENIYPYAFQSATQQNIYEIFPGKNMADALTNEWQQRYHRPLKYVAGERFYTLNMAVYSTEHPFAYFECDNKKSPWISDKELQKYGAIFVWNKPGEPAPACEMDKRFPNAIIAPLHYFAWALPRWPQKLFGFAQPSPAVVGVAFLPPAS